MVIIIKDIEKGIEKKVSQSFSLFIIRTFLEKRTKTIIPEEKLLKFNRDNSEFFDSNFRNSFNMNFVHCSTHFKEKKMKIYS